MHLLNAIPGGAAETDSAVDLQQTPGEIVILSAADSELAGFSAAQAQLGPGTPTLRLASLLQLRHPYAVDLYAETVIANARLVIVRLLGGQSYWPYGVERLTALCRARNIKLAWLSGDRQHDPGLEGFSTLEEAACARLFAYCREGGLDNLGQALRYAATLIGRDATWREPKPIPPAGLYWPGLSDPDLAAIRARGKNRPAAAIVFYRALMQAGDVAPVDAMIEALDDAGLDALPIYVASLKDKLAAALLDETLQAARPGVILNSTSFAVAAPGKAADDVLSHADCPVFQILFASQSRAAWEANPRGLNARDLAINVALPEVDGRILTRAVAFKAEAAFDPRTECPIIRLEADPERCRQVAGMAARWARLRAKPAAEKKIALMLANYPGRDGRLGNGVGLDAPESMVRILAALRDAGYAIADPPADGDALIRRLCEGPTNDIAALPSRRVRAHLPLGDYRRAFAALPAAVQQAVTARWGAPESDPYQMAEGFAIPVLPLGHAAVLIQPARGHHLDPAKTYHDPDLPPPHHYLAVYVWLREAFGADALVQVGKHGNLEWLPGKALALSAACFPEAALGPLPVIYPFIVNDPGEGAQAKRRTAAVIVDHLTPPLTRAETYGDLAALERLVDEYYEAAGLDRRRLAELGSRILAETRRLGLDADCGIAPEEPTERALIKLDNHLCELKELQIRDGLHVFGETPAEAPLADLLVALARLPRAQDPGKPDQGKAGGASLLDALSRDLGLGFAPLDADFAAPWAGPRPPALQALSDAPWRNAGDTVERLELLARELVRGAALPETWTATRAVLAQIEGAIRPALEACGAAEMAALLRALEGRFIAPGPSGAPTRGRVDVLPTGRNFYSLDARTLPTPAAWTLGWKSAALLLERHRQEHGDWPRALLLNVWGTANMRTGGDDIAQALALIGARPTWETASGRVTGFEILPLDLLDRPRIDVTLKMSGFFRDAFPAQVALFDQAVKAIQRLDEPPEMNPLKGEAGARLFGPKPGAYGTGLDTRMEHGGWESPADLAEAYLAWGGYAYADEGEGTADREGFERRLARVEAVVQNQDNREHDLLDSDNYWQFEGGAVAAVQALSGRAPVAYHNDLSRPDAPRIRTLEQEIARVVRGRAANPKWLAGLRRHGYKGAAEMAASVDYLFAFAAMSGAVRDHHFEALFEAYLADAASLDFLRAHNPAALREMAARFLEAIRRGLWRPRANSAEPALRQLREAA